MASLTDAALYLFHKTRRDGLVTLVEAIDMVPWLSDFLTDVRTRGRGTPEPGDIISPQLFPWEEHVLHAIYASDHEVIQLTPEGVIVTSTLEAFLAGEPLEIVDLEELARSNMDSLRQVPVLEGTDDKADAVDRARKMVGRPSDDHPFQTSLQFAVWCRTGIAVDQEAMEPWHS